MWLKDVKWHGWTMLAALVAWCLYQVGWEAIKCLLTSSVTTAWVQAIGSIATVWAAFAVVQRQHKLAATKEAERERAVLRNQLLRIKIATQQVRAIAYVANDSIGKAPIRWVSVAQTARDIRRMVADATPTDVLDYQLARDLGFISLGLTQLTTFADTAATRKEAVNRNDAKEAIQYVRRLGEKCKAIEEKVTALLASSGHES